MLIVLVLPDVPVVDDPVPEVVPVPEDGLLVVEDCEVEVESSTVPEEVVALPEPIPTPDVVDPEVVSDDVEEGYLPDVDELVDVVSSSEPEVVSVEDVVDESVPTPCDP